MPRLPGLPRMGTASTRQSTRSLAEAGPLADIVLKDLDGRDVRLGDTWREQPAALVFLRHYG